MSNRNWAGKLFRRLAEKVSDSAERTKAASKGRKESKHQGDAQAEDSQLGVVRTRSVVRTETEYPSPGAQDSACTPHIEGAEVKGRALEPSGQAQDSAPESPQYRQEEADRVGLVSGSPPSSELVVGIDFGSCWTKAVVRDTNRRMTWGVPFNEAVASTGAYLQYTAVAGLTEGQPRLVEAPATGRLDSIKVRLLERARKASASGPTSEEIESVVFLALILGVVKKYVGGLHPSYQGGRVDWHFNLGVPVSSNSAQAELRLFRRVLVAALGIAGGGTITKSDVCHALQMAEEDECGAGVHSDKINAVPEVAAEVAGYANRERPQGLQFLMDVGATTLDIAAFIVHEKDGSDHYELLYTDVKAAGCSEFTKQQAESLATAMRQLVRSHGLENYGMSRMPTGLEEFMPPVEAMKSAASRAFENSREEFGKKTAAAVLKVILHTRRDRYPRAPEWDQWLPTFLCGGGSTCGIYEDVLKMCEHKLSGMGWRWEGFQKTPMPRPSSDELKAPLLGPDDFHRLAVAYGLSHHLLEIGEVHLPEEIPDAEGPELKERLPEITV